MNDRAQEPDRAMWDAVAAEMRCARCSQMTTTFSLVVQGTWAGKLLCPSCMRTLERWRASAVGPSEFKAGREPAKD